MKGSRQVATTLVPVAACCLALACSRKRSQEEIPPAPITLAPTAAPVVRELPPPGPAEVDGVVKRVFRDDALAGEGDGEPGALVGDFNGDLSQDIAVVVKPAPGKVGRLNEEPRWILDDPLAPVGTAGELDVQAGEPLLAIIHGNGPDGWRDSQATQTFLLKNVVGAQMKVERGEDFASANQGRNLPRIHGDVIGEVLRGTQGYIYYTGPTYGWYDPKTFMGEPRSQAVHGRSRGGSN